VVVAALTALAVARPLGHGGPAGGSARWQRVFFDDFNRGLRASRWGRYSGQPGGDPGGWWAPSHVVVRKGILNLRTYRDARFGGRWVSGGVSSARALRQKYGRYKVRLRMDRGKGVAAIALLGLFAINGRPRSTSPSGDRYASCPDTTTPDRVDFQIDWVAAYAYRRPHTPR
jgi:hypothetical protein